MANSQAMVNHKDMANHLPANTVHLQGSTALHKEETMVLRPVSMAHLHPANTDHQVVPTTGRPQHPPSATFPASSPTSTCPAPPTTSARQ
jgi:hypothetical protein